MGRRAAPPHLSTFTSASVNGTRAAVVAVGVFDSSQSEPRCFGTEVAKINVWDGTGGGLVWSAPSCAKLSHLFSDFCVCVRALGIDSLVRSLKEALRLTTLEVPKQGLLLLTEILERCVGNLHAYPTLFLF